MDSFIFSFTAIIQITVFVFLAYYFVISLFGLYKKNDSAAESCKPEKRFAMIVAAHDEEVVIANIIESLKSIDYPNELYDIMIIADNCQDKTASISKEYNDVKVFERNIPDKKGKGYALEWMFDRIFKMDKKYDAICIFDADNLISKNFLLEMNYKLLSGYKVVQGYIDSKNPHDSWITESYSISFWSANRLFQLGRSNLGLSNQIGGTGFCMDTEVLKQLGWGATCLTEDLEFTCKLVLNGQKVGWAHNAIVYDEKPLTLKQSWHQRKRWMQGFSDVSSRFFFKLLKKAFKEKDFVAFDCALYTTQPFFTVAVGVTVLLTLLQNNTEHGLNIFVINYLFTPWVWKTFSIFQFMFTPLVMVMEAKLSKKMFGVFALYSLNIIVFTFVFGNTGKLFEIAAAYAIYFLAFVAILFIVDRKRFSLKMFVWYMLFGFYTLTWIPISIHGILDRNKKEWSHTKHSRQISIQEVE
jgi:cellulose synthase/poly-beta-1,6-N-acetylglucosamine synthase-like glycosyltransferase